MSILKVQNLSKSYGEGETKITAVDDASFEVEEGAFVAIVGESGSGKSTLLHMIGGVDKPSSGTITINGTNIYELSEEKQAEFRRKEVALIYQFYNLIPVLNVEENMCLPIKLDGGRVETDKLEELIAKLGLEERKKNLPNELSGRTAAKSSDRKKLTSKP